MKKWRWIKWERISFVGPEGPRHQRRQEQREMDCIHKWCYKSTWRTQEPKTQVVFLSLKWLNKNEEKSSSVQQIHNQKRERKSFQKCHIKSSDSLLPNASIGNQLVSGRKTVLFRSLWVFSLRRRGMDKEETIIINIVRDDNDDDRQS
jgi:hypothetical protein